MALSLQAQVLALRSALEASLSGTSADTSGPPVPWTPGQRLTAQVEADLTSGRYQIRVGTFQFDVELPAKAQVGDTLRLEFLSSSPRVAFALMAEPAQEAAVEGGTKTAPVQISAAGRTLTELLQTGSAAARPAATAPTPVQDPTPLLPAPPRDAAELAAAFKGALERSGLFYESHLLQWFAGDRPLAALLHEPQGRLSAAAQQAQSSSPPRAAAQAAQARTGDPTAAAPHAPASSTSEVIVAGSSPPERPSHAQALDPQVLGQVRSQLDVIEQRQIVWQGQAWPGQPLEWRIDEPPEHSAAPDEPMPWTTHLRLQLPHLGMVNAELGLTGGNVRVQLGAESSASADALRRAHSELIAAFSQAGLVLAGFAVKDQ